MADHTLSLLESSPYPSRCFCCNLCHTEGCGPVYHCSDCDFDIHASCAAIAIQQTHFSHPHHPLLLSHRGSCRCTCDSCGSAIRTWSFRCDLCNFDIHSMCARAPQSIVHPRHADPLILLKASDVPGRPNLCDGCKMPVTDYFYRCRTCPYNLHQACATLPTEINHGKHPAHILTFVDQRPQERHLRTCRECGNLVEGWRFHCAICNFNLHPRCALPVHELPHVNFDGDRAQIISSGTILANTSVAHNLSHAIRVPTVSCSISHTAVLPPSQSDWEAVERVLQFSKEMAKWHPAQEIASKKSKEEQEDCPTCLEGFNLTNPKKTTSCGHHFHLPCILEWMEKSSNCPLCRNTFSLVA